MKIILDECLPRRLGLELKDHEVQTVQEMGWSAKSNGELLGLIAGHFDLFVTIDSNMVYQQHMKARPFGLIVLHTKSNAMESILPLIFEINTGILNTKRGEVTHVGSKL